MRKATVAAAASLLACAVATAQVPGGRVVVCNDNQTFTATAWQMLPADTAAFAANVVNWFLNGASGAFLVYSNNVAFADPQLASLMTTSGHLWIVDTSLSFDLQTLSQFDAVFLCGPVNGAVPDPAVVFEYVARGGNVYLAGGTSLGVTLNSWELQWNPFLNQVGLDFAGVSNQLNGVTPVTGTHPILSGVGQLYFIGGNDVTDLDPIDPRAEVLAGGRIGVADFEFVGACGAGTVTLPSGPVDLLSVDGSTGGTMRRVFVTVNAAVAVTVAQPPANPVATPLVVWGMFGSPAAGDIFMSPFGTFCFPPDPLFEFPWLFTLVDGLANDPGALLPATPAPWTRSVTAPPFPVRFTLQGLVFQNQAASNNLGITNAIVVEVENVPTPTIAAIVPELGPPGTLVSIIGTDFRPGLTLTLDGVIVNPTQITPSQIDFVVPGPVSCDTPLTVTNPGGSPASSTFNPSPVIASLLPTAGPASGGAPLAIQGDFTPGSTVSVGGIPAAIISQSPSVIVVMTPPGQPGATAITVTSSTGCSASASYTYL